MHRYRLAGVVLGVVGLSWHAALADETSSDGVWTTVGEIPAEHLAGGAWVRPDVCQPVILNLGALQNILALAPMEDTPEAQDAPIILRLPTPQGQFARFRVVESPIMEPGLAAQLPGTKTYLGQGIDDPAATLRADWTEQGFHAQVLTPEGSYWVDPYTRGNVLLYSSYHKDGLRNMHGFDCLVKQRDLGKPVLPDEVRNAAGPALATGGTRRQYRLANACTGEYASFHGGSQTAAQNAIVTAVNRVTGVYELECAIRLVLVGNNLNVVYTNGSTDPYSNNNGGSMLSQNISTCNSRIGSANYDIGHVYSTGGGGVAYLDVVCTSNKAGGVTGSPSPTGDAFWIDYVAHEMGHQFGANHNFNGTASSCGGGNRNGSTAYEPGSGNSIMAYAGICGGDNLQSHSDAYFQHVSYGEIYTNVPSCSSNTSTGNNPPTVNAGPNYTIPANTPFELVAVGSDPDGDSISYQWDERDLGPSQSASGGIIADNGSSPFIRGRIPTTSPNRLVPRLTNLLNNTFQFGERLPNTNRNINFRCTVRDNRAGSGGVNWDDMVITSVNTGAGFAVTAPNTNVSWSGAQTVTWNVAGTTGNGIDCANVAILLSTDGGNTWPTTLLASTPNDGSQSVTLPSVSTSQARIKVAAVGNIFFDISNVNFTITPGVPANPTNVVATPSAVCPGQNTSLTATVGSGETVYWYTGGCGTTQVGTGSPLVVSPASTTTYFARARRNSDNVFSSGCGNVTVTVNALPTAPSGASSDRDYYACSEGGTITLTAIGGSGTTVRWFSGSCGTTQVGATNPLTIPAPTATTTYHVRYETSCGNSSCASVEVHVIGADFNGDTFITGEDFDEFVALFEAGDAGADINGDTFVTGEDFDLYLEAFYWGC